jgi:hypothetical protein
MKFLLVDVALKSQCRCRQDAGYKWLYTFTLHMLPCTRYFISRVGARHSWVGLYTQQCCVSEVAKRGWYDTTFITGYLTSTAHRSSIPPRQISEQSHEQIGVAWLYCAPSANPPGSRWKISFFPISPVCSRLTLLDLRPIPSSLPFPGPSHLPPNRPTHYTVPGR